MHSYHHYSASSSELGTDADSPPQGFRRSRSVKSDSELSLEGPLDVHGSVKSGGSIVFDGDFVIRDKIDAYGAITINGSVTSR
jgi:cytoskeletal protein CcmA (bactofilin family)